MSLATWQTNGWLEVHQSSRQEIADLLKVVERDLHDSKATDVSADWRSNIAYNAALQAAKAAMHASGYRAARGANSHYRTIQSLSLTIGLDAKSIRTLDVYRLPFRFTAMVREMLLQRLRALGRASKRTPSSQPVLLPQCARNDDLSLGAHGCGGHDPILAKR